MRLLRGLGTVLFGLWHLFVAMVLVVLISGYMVWWVLTGWEDDWKQAMDSW